MPVERAPKVLRHRLHSRKPCPDHRNIFLNRAKSDFGAKAEITDRKRKSIGKGKQFMAAVSRVVIPFQDVQQREGFVQRQRTDRVGEQKRPLFGGRTRSRAGSVGGTEELRSEISSTPCACNRSRAIFAISLACASNSSGSGFQSVLTTPANCATGLISIPTLGMPRFLHSMTVVPVPQKGSSTRVLAVAPKRSRYSPTRCGGKESTKRYQSCTARSSGASLLLSRIAFRTIAGGMIVARLSVTFRAPSIEGMHRSVQTIH